jgi:CheY-like chemotaxis protein
MPPGEPLTILLVEDDPTDTVLFKALLGHTTSFTSLHADSLASATDQLGANEVDLIVLDLGLPDSTFDTTYRRIHDTAPEVPVIVLTAHDEDGAAYQALADGAQDYLVKQEVTETLLAKAIRYAVERHGSKERLKRQTVEELEVYASLAPELSGHAPASPLAADRPDEIDAFVERYGDLIDQAVEAGYRATEADLTVQIDDLAARLADMRATPPDLAAVHAGALAARQSALPAEQFSRAEDVGRLLLLRLTGELANQYRQRIPNAEPADDGEPLPADGRDRLVDSLAALLSQHPLDAITLEDVARHAELGISAVRAAVGGVREPLAALLQREFARQRTEAEVQLGQIKANDAESASREIVVVLVELWRTGRVATAAAMAAAGDETVQGLRYRHLRELTTRCLDALPVADADQERLRQLAFAELFAVLDQKLLVGELFPGDQNREGALEELTVRLVDRLGPRRGRAAPPPPGGARRPAAPADDEAPAPRPVAAAGPTKEEQEEAAKRLTGADYTAWADRMRQRRRSEIDSLYAEEEPAQVLDDKWSPEHLFKPTDEGGAAE